MSTPPEDSASEGMSPIVALYHVCLELGPVPQTKRNDNLTPKEAVLRDAIAVLKDCVLQAELQQWK